MEATKPKTFADVPEHWKAPFGPYRQAPAEYGGEWWYVSPFTGAEPWLRFAPIEQEERELPPGFVDIFGEEPTVTEDSQASRIARVQWLQDLKYFNVAGFPGWVEPTTKENAIKTFQAWEMGEPKGYDGRYGWMVRFPGSQIRDFEVAAHQAFRSTHHVIAQYQIDLAQAGIKVTTRHPLVPPQVFGD